MGLFGFLDKKNCAMCGADIGAIFSGSAKISEGTICKNCIAKLSPYFRGFANATVDSIQEQMDYREANKEEVAAFRTTRSFGLCSTKLLIDETQGKFIVANASNYMNTNPDVFNCSDVTSCNLDIDCSESEIRTKDGEGHSVSYNPKRYEYRYDFFIEIGVNHPYASQLRFKINDDSVELQSIVTPIAGAAMPMGGMPPHGASMGGQRGSAMGAAAGNSLRAAMGGARPAAAAGRSAAPAGPARSASGHVAPGAKAGARPAATTPSKMGAAAAKPGARPAAAQGRPGMPSQGAGRPGMPPQGAGRPAAPMQQPVTVTKPDPLADANYVNYQQQGEEIKWALMNARQEARQQEAVASAPKIAVQCQCCGATTIPDAAGCCEYCGGPAGNGGYSDAAFTDDGSNG